MKTLFLLLTTCLALTACDNKYPDTSDPAPRSVEDSAVTHPNKAKPEPSASPDQE